VSTAVRCQCGEPLERPLLGKDNACSCHCCPLPLALLVPYAQLVIARCGLSVSQFSYGVAGDHLVSFDPLPHLALSLSCQIDPAATPSYLILSLPNALVNGFLETMADHAFPLHSQMPSVVRNPKTVWPGLHKAGMYQKHIAGDGKSFPRLTSFGRGTC
jgi:hypothetical protein